MTMSADERARQRIYADLDRRNAANAARRRRRAAGPEVAARETDPEFLTLYAKDKAWKVVTEVAKNEHTPRAVRVELAAHWSYAVRGAVAETLPDLGDLEGAFLRDPEARVRRSLAQRSDLASATWAALTHDPDPYVRMKVAKNPAAPESSVADLLSDSDGRVKYVMIRSDRLDDAALLRLLADDTSAEVALALSRLDQRAFSDDVLRAFCASSNKWVRCNVVDRRDCPRTILEVLVGDDDTEVRGRVALHPNADAEILTRLMVGRARSVHDQVARREDGVDFITTHENWAVRLKGVQAIPKHLPGYARFLSDDDARVRAAAVHVRCSDDTFERLSRDPEAKVRAQVAQKTSLASVLDRLAGDPDWRVRVEVARNRMTPGDVIARLATDPTAKVAAAAAEAFLTALAR